MGAQGPFLFPGWSYDGVASSSPPTYRQAILNQAPSTQTVSVAGVLLCNIAASGTNAATTAIFTGYTLSDQPITTSGSFPSWTSYANITFSAAWQPLKNISIVTSGNPSTYTTELWDISMCGSPNSLADYSLPAKLRSSMRRAHGSCFRSLSCW